MTKQNVLPADTYTVINKTILRSDFNDILFMLYQPIIGSDAISLYLTLCSYLDSQNLSSTKWTHHQLMTSMRQDLSKIMYSKDKLEAMGLLKTYIKSDDVNDFIYELYSPLDPYDFFENPLLATSLFNNVGEVDFKRIIDNFKTANIVLKDYKDISCSFYDVFEVKEFLPIEKLLEDLKYNNKLGLSIDFDLNIDEMLSSIPSELLNKKNVTKSMKEFLYKIAYTYNYDDGILKKIVLESLDNSKSISKELVRKNAKSYYKFENHGKLPSIINKVQPDYLKSNSNEVSAKNKLIYQFENTTPFDYLKLRNMGVRPSKAEVTLLEELLIDYKLNPGVVNVLIDYVLKTNNNKLTKNYVLAIASQWVKSEVKTVSDAMEIAIKEKSKKYKPTRKATIKEAPSWIDQDISGEEASLEEQKKFDELLKSIE